MMDEGDCAVAAADAVLLLLIPNYHSHHVHLLLHRDHHCYHRKPNSETRTSLAPEPLAPADASSREVQGQRIE